MSVERAPNVFNVLNKRLSVHTLLSHLIRNTWQNMIHRLGIKSYSSFRQHIFNPIYHFSMIDTYILKFPARGFPLDI